MSDVLIRIIVAVCRMFGARTRLLAKPVQDPNNTQSAMRVGLLAGFVKLRFVVRTTTLLLGQLENRHI